MFLTSPYIDQAISLKCPAQGQMSVMGILRQQPGIQQFRAGRDMSLWLS
jgi:hypothetical protein